MRSGKESLEKEATLIDKCLFPGGQPGRIPGLAGGRSPTIALISSNERHSARGTSTTTTSSMSFTVQSVFHCLVVIGFNATLGMGIFWVLIYKTDGVW